MNEKNFGGIDRRTVLKGAGAAGLVLASGGAFAATARKRYAVVGVGSRARMFTNAMTGKFRDTSEVVAICDKNAGRLARAVKLVTETGASQPRGYAAADFDRMIRETRPEYVIVTTPDATHDDYIVRALEAGCDVITEKPMTTTAEKAQRIIDAVKRTGRQVRVTFNYRYSPPRTQIKELLMSGEIGDVISVDGPLSGTADTTVAFYNLAREQTGTISADPDGAGGNPNLATRTTYDSAGRPYLIEQGYASGQTASASATARLAAIRASSSTCPTRPKASPKTHSSISSGSCA